MFNLGSLGLKGKGAKAVQQCASTSAASPIKSDQISVVKSPMKKACAPRFLLPAAVPGIAVFFERAQRVYICEMVRMWL